MSLNNTRKRHNRVGNRSSEPDDITENKKTNLEQQQNTSSSSDSSSNHQNVHIKVLIPSSSGGAIIGKGGETIADLQKETGAKVKMSKANDFYPGTNERVCLISGNLRSILEVIEFIIEKIKDNPDPTSRPAIDFDNKVSAEREKQVKLLIANSTAGMIIGKAGAFIKQIKEESGSFVQLSQKSKDVRLTERVVTVIGDPDNNLKALEMILTRVEEDPHSGSFLNVSYGELQGQAVANANPTGSPFALNNTNNNHSNGDSAMEIFENNKESSSSANNNPFVIPLTTGGALNLKFNMNPGRPPTDPALMGQYLSHMGGSLRQSGYSDIATDEIVQSLRCLATHGVLVINLSASNDSFSSPSRSQTPHHQQQHQHQQQQFHLHQQQASPFLNNVLTSPTRTFQFPQPQPQPTQRVQLQQQQQQGSPFMVPAAINGFQRFEDFRSLSPTRNVLSPNTSSSSQLFGLRSNNNLGNNHSGPPPPPPGVEEQQQQSDLEVNENIVGAVIGPSGRFIVDIQQYSGAKVKISRKGSFSPGTRNRVVTISGSPDAIANARRMIEHKIMEEENKRERKN